MAINGGAAVRPAAKTTIPDPNAAAKKKKKAVGTSATAAATGAGATKVTPPPAPAAPTPPPANPFVADAATNSAQNLVGPMPSMASVGSGSGVTYPGTGGRETVTGGGSQWTNDHSDPVGGFAARYPTAQLGNVMAQPGILAEDVLTSMGLGPNKQMLASYGSMTQYAPLIAEILSSLSGNARMEAGVNSMADFMQQGATPGGRALDDKALLASLLNPGQGSDFGKMFGQIDPDTGLPITADQQMSLLMPYLSAAMSGTTPLHQRAQRAALTTATSDFNAANARGQQVPGASFLDYLRQQGVLG